MVSGSVLKKSALLFGHSIVTAHVRDFMHDVVPSNCDFMFFILSLLLCGMFIQ